MLTREEKLRMAEGGIDQLRNIGGFRGGIQEVFSETRKRITKT